MTKAEVISLINTYLTEKTGKATTDQEKAATSVDKEQILEVVEAFFEVIKDAMQEGDNVYMRGFGSFVNKKRARKLARHIKEKKSIIVEPHYIPSFKPSRIFMDMIKNSPTLKEALRKEDEKV